MSGTSKESRGPISGTARIASSKVVSGSYGGMYVPETPVLTITDVSFSITRTAITISYTVSAEATCRISYATAVDEDIMLLEYALFSPNHETHAHEISGLAEGTEYHISVRAYDTSGNNAFAPALTTWYAVRTATAEVAGEYIGIV